MDRKEELFSLIKKDDETTIKLCNELIDNILFLEDKLKEMRTIPLYKIHPEDNMKQKISPVGKLYRDYLNTYTTSLKALNSLIDKEDTEEETPLEKWIKENQNNEPSF